MIVFRLIVILSAEFAKIPKPFWEIFRSQFMLHFFPSLSLLKTIILEWIFFKNLGQKWVFLANCFTSKKKNHMEVRENGVVRPTFLRVGKHDGVSKELKQVSVDTYMGVEKIWGPAVWGME